MGLITHTHRCTHTSIDGGVAMAWVPLGWTVSAKKNMPHFYSTYNVFWVLLTCDTRKVVSVCVCVWVCSQLFAPSLLHDAHRCTEPLSQSVLYSTFPLPVASAIALLMQPHGHNRGIMGASTWFTPLSVRLSSEGANCWSHGCKRPASAESLQTNTVCMYAAPSTQTDTHSQNGDLCPI